MLDWLFGNFCFFLFLSNTVFSLVANLLSAAFFFSPVFLFLFIFLGVLKSKTLSLEARFLSLTPFDCHHNKVFWCVWMCDCEWCCVCVCVCPVDSHIGSINIVQKLSGIRCISLFLSFYLFFISFLSLLFPLFYFLSLACPFTILSSVSLSLESVNRGRQFYAATLEPQSKHTNINQHCETENTNSTYSYCAPNDGRWTYWVGERERERERENTISKTERDQFWREVHPIPSHPIALSFFLSLVFLKKRTKFLPSSAWPAWMIWAQILGGGEHDKNRDQGAL